VYLVAGDVENIEPGIYRYLYYDHSLVQVAAGDRREQLAAAALCQGFIAEAPTSIVLAAEYERTTARYRERGIRYVHMEAGHVAQNICLQATALGLGSVIVGAFEDENVKELLEIEEEPLMIVPFGYPAE